MTARGKGAKAKKYNQGDREGEPVPPAFKPLWQQFEKTFKNAMKDSYCSKDTLFKNRSRMRQFAIFCVKEFKIRNLRNIGDKHISAYVERRRQVGRTEKVIKNDLSAIRMFHKFIPNARHRISGNDKFKLQSTPDGRLDRVWDEREYRTMIDRARELGRGDVEMVIRLARNSGLRIHECLRINKKMAERFIDKGVITIKGKGGRVRDVPLREEARKVLQIAAKKIDKGNDKLFVPRGRRTDLVKDSIENFIAGHRDSCTDHDQKGSDVKITFHGLRHTYAREEYLKRLSNGMPERKAQKEVALLLGHGRPNVVKIYLGSLGS
ncbi:MAG: integrase [Firmicutes bacterium]|nr:integrase [Bacillota bacterium]